MPVNAYTSDPGGSSLIPCFPCPRGPAGPPGPQGIPGTARLNYALVYSTVSQTLAGSDLFTFNTIMQNNGFSLLTGNSVVIADAGVYRVDFHVTATAAPASGYYQINILNNTFVVPGDILYTAVGSQLSGSFIMTIAAGDTLTFEYVGTAPTMTTATNPGSPNAPTVSVLITKYAG